MSANANGGASSASSGQPEWARGNELARHVDTVQAAPHVRERGARCAANQLWMKSLANVFQCARDALGCVPVEVPATSDASDVAGLHGELERDGGHQEERPVGSSLNGQTTRRREDFHAAGSVGEFLTNLCSLL